MKMITDLTIKQRSKLMLGYFLRWGRKIKFFAGALLLFSAFNFIFPMAVSSGNAGDGIYTFISLAILAGSIVFFILAMLNVFVPMLTIEDFKYICRDDYLTGYHKAFNELSIPIKDKEYIAAPIEVLTPAVFPGRNKIIYRYHKKENELVCSHSNYEWLFFGHTHLYYFSVCVNHIDGSVGFTRGLEVKYRDIAIVETITSFGVNEKQGKRTAVDLLQLKLTFVNGDPLMINIRCQPILHGDRIPNPITVKEENIISTIRGTIRRAKNA